MRFEYRMISTLPRLAWCLTLRRRSEVVHVTHGSSVETFDTFFVDGAWFGEFTDSAVESTDVMMGAGGVLRDGGLVLVTPSHPMEGLYAHRQGDVLRVSPSLPFLLSQTNTRLDLNFIPYHETVFRYLGGLRHHVGKLPLASGESFDVYRFRNLRIDSDLRIDVRMKPEPPSFRSFTEYREFLAERLSGIVANAAASHRRIKYHPLATVSSGYDSAACAALATELDCREAVTIRTARRDSRRSDDVNDSGAALAHVLGMRVHEFERDMYRSSDGLPEAEFVAAGDLGQDFVLKAFEKHFANRLVLTGLHGDVIWNRLLKHPLRRDFIRLDPGGASIGEFRARVGFVHVPVPCMAAMRFPEIFRISRSREMKPWTLGTKYDRPIPRRIAEEKGIPRDAFGQKKHAITVLLNNNDAIDEQMHPGSRASFDDFYSNLRVKRSPHLQSRYERGYRLYQVCGRLLARPNKVLHRLNMGWHVPNPVPSKYRNDPDRPSYLIHWGIANVLPRYELEDV